METTTPMKEESTTSVSSDFDYKELARQIVLLTSDSTLLTAEDVGVMLSYPPRYIRETISLSPGFPKAIRLGLPSDTPNDGSKKTTKLSNRRWRRCDIESWIDSHRNGRRPGAPKRND